MSRRDKLKDTYKLFKDDFKALGYSQNKFVKEFAHVRYYDKKKKELKISKINNRLIAKRERYYQKLTTTSKKQINENLTKEFSNIAHFSLKARNLKETQLKSNIKNTLNTLEKYIRTEEDRKRLFNIKFVVNHKDQKVMNGLAFVNYLTNHGKLDSYPFNYSNEQIKSATKALRYVLKNKIDFNSTKDFTKYFNTSLNKQEIKKHGFKTFSASEVYGVAGSTFNNLGFLRVELTTYDSKFQSQRVNNVELVGESSKALIKWAAYLKQKGINQFLIDAFGVDIAENMHLYGPKNSKWLFVNEKDHEYFFFYFNSAKEIYYANR
ncbi:P38 [Mycoplasma phage P1]|uniref:P38 n=1 Tax=Mycoplasma phage P1 TaxID=2905920 RepID=Q9FZR7_9CAUD|nr:P38 [Mycoplasma phage P1]AAG01277.1 P38 [Mycoplasma phage P1]